MVEGRLNSYTPNGVELIHAVFVFLTPNGKHGKVFPMSKTVDPASLKIIDLVKGDKKVRFAYYREREFWYQHDDGLLFPVALSEVDNDSVASKVTLPAEEKAIFFMRWMRKYIELAKKEAELNGSTNG
jgi:hypothetical protein